MTNRSLKLPCSMPLAAHSRGSYGDVRRIAAVVLESDRSLSVIAEDKIGDRSALNGLVNPSP